MLDYGGQYSQLIARRVRDCGVFSELLPHHVPLEEIARRKPRGIILSGRARVGVRRRRAAARARAARAGRAGAGHLLRHAAARARRSAVASSRRRSGSSGARICGCSDPGVLLDGDAARADVLDVAPRHRLRAAAGLHGAGLLERLAGRRGGGRRAAASTASSSTPRSCTPPTAQEILTRFLTEVCGCEPTWSAASIVEEQIRRIREQVGDGQRDLRAVGRRRLLGRGAARAPRRSASS